ncbi:YGGT family protein [compost metagenome]
MGIGAGVVGFIFFILGALLQLLLFAIIANAILSWLFAFDVINYRNRFVAQVAEFLDRFTSPVLAPLRRFIPPLGGMDLTPIVALLIIQGVQGYLLPPLHVAALGLVGAY